MRFDTWARRLALAVGAVALLVAGGLAYGPIAGLAQDTPATAEIGVDEAIQIASEAHPNSTVVEAEREREHGTLIYEVSFADGVDVDVDATTGEVLKVEQPDRDDLNDDIDDCDDHDGRHEADHDDDDDDDDFDD